MSEEFDLIADFREDQGKGASRRLRKTGRLPAIIYGAGRPARAITLDQNKVLHQLEQESFYSSVLTIKVGDKSQAVILKDIQRHPSKSRIMHMDFQRIVEDQEIRMNVPLHFVGGDIAPGIKAGGMISHLMTDVEVICLPRDLPEYLTVDVSAMNLDEMIHLSGIALPKGVEIPELAQGEDHDQPVVSLHRPKKVVEEETETEAAAEVPATTEKPAAPDED